MPHLIVKRWEDDTETRVTTYIVTAIYCSSVKEKLNGAGTRSNIVCWLTICTGDVVGAVNQVVEQETEKAAKGIGDQIQTLLNRRIWGQIDSVGADGDRDDNIFADWLALC